MEVCFKYGHRKLLIGVGGELDWLPGKNAQAMLKKESKAAAAYARMYYLLKGVDEFVQAHFAMGVVEDVLNYIFDTIWTDLREAEKECYFSQPAIMYRQIMLLDRFVNELGCMVPEEMWRYNLYGRNVSTMGKGHTGSTGQGSTAGGKSTTGGGGGAAGGSMSRAEVEKLIQAAKGSMGSGTGGGGGGHGGNPFDKFGVAAALPSFKSSDVDLKGQPYKNLVGGAYMGSVCDFCETNGFNFRHHPLRCNRKFPNWRTSPPEIENAEVEFEVRGGKKATLKTVGK